MTIKIITADPDPEFLEEIKYGLGGIPNLEVVAGTTEPEEIDTMAKKEAADVLLLGPGWEKGMLLDLVTGIRGKRPSLALLAAVTDFDSFSQKALDAGAEETFLVPIETTKLLLAIERSLKALSGDPGPKEGKVITVFSTKGGVGKTVVSINLAIALSKRQTDRVTIMDLDLQFGDVGVMLKQSPKYTIHDLVAGEDSIDPKLLDSVLTPYSEQVRTLLAPLQPELADLVLPAVVEPTLDALKKLSDFVIVDTPPSFNDNILAVLDQSDFVLLVGAMDLPSVKNIKLCLQTMSLLGYPDEKIKLILNRVEKGVGLQISEIEESLKRKVNLAIPNDKTVLLSVNKGVPVLIEAPKSPAGQAFSKLTDVLRRQGSKALLTA